MLKTYIKADQLKVIEKITDKYEIGRYIVEDEQEGNYKAAHGKKVLRGCLHNSPWIML